ncbi:BAG family molecular chaperone regulator 7 [Mercurialis annua]|uniref:BAG family molecular chaperone regulator 7 n=1 Tax=Mercurialis annua TaxID=3986 RepID=UPI00215ED885|nr:BAG family molecular chaperone regulator 7 [Mercurialis annua]
MSRFRRIEIFDPFYHPSFFTPSVLIEEGYLDCDLFIPSQNPFELFDTVSDLIQVETTPALCSYRRMKQRAGTELYLQKLGDRVSALESRFEKLMKPKINGGGERKYTWTAEIKGPVERKFKLSTEIKDDKKKSYKWIAEIKGKEEDQPVTRRYTYEVHSGEHGSECDGSEKKEKTEKKEKKQKHGGVRVVEIKEEDNDHGAVVLRQAFAKRAGAVRGKKGKKKELEPENAALMIQMGFRAYLIRRSMALRALRELAIAKAKLKELRSLFNNFSYRRQIGRDAVERQRFSEKIIVLLLTVDAIEGADLMVRSAKRSMVDELEAMLDVVDPQPQGKSLSMRRRTFDMPDSAIQKEIAEGVAQVVQLLDEEENRHY